MPHKMFITPARPGLIVRDPETGAALAAGGEYKPRTPYWIRRKKTGDVIEATPSVEALPASRKDKVTK